MSLARLKSGRKPSKVCCCGRPVHALGLCKQSYARLRSARSRKNRWWKRKRKVWEAQHREARLAKQKVYRQTERAKELHRDRQHRYQARLKREFGVTRRPKRHVA